MSSAHTPRGLAVPAGRFSRMARMGGMAAGVAGNMALNGARQALTGQRPSANALLLTPANARRITAQLAQMRGAAMKMGQLLSMEAGDFVSPELSEILATLRQDAHFMPPAQLKSVLTANWGPDFLRKFKRFDTRPIAAASIGQVHRALTQDGRDVAIKVQYPGVRDSIDSDVKNVAALIRLSGLIPASVPLKPLLEEARAQLHEEADYAREGAMLARFGTLLADHPAFTVPVLQPDLTTRDILGMSFATGQPIEALTDAPQSTRNAVIETLIRLVLTELFTFNLMQTDPNFANYRHDPETGRIVLLDFGAAREIGAQTAHDYTALLRAGLGADEAEMRAGLLQIGFVAPDTLPHHITAILELMHMAMEPLGSDLPFDFAGSDLTGRMRQKGMAFAEQRDFWVIPPAETLFIQRKIGGIFLLATRLRAQVALGPLMAEFLRP